MDPELWQESKMKSKAFIGFLGILLLTGCQYKELCYDHNHWVNVRVSYDWSHTKGTKQDVDGMSALFYNDKYAEPVRYDLPGRDGGVVRLIPGTYGPLSYNNDTESILLRGMDRIETAEAYTRQSSMSESTRLMTTKGEFPRAKGAEEEPVILEPDMFWAAYADPFSLAMGDGEHSLVLALQQRVMEITITIYNVPNLQYTSQFGGSMTGLSGSVKLLSGEISDQCVTQAFPISVKDETTLEMKFRIFGHCPHEEEGSFEEHQLTIYAILSDGSQWYYTQNVTEQMHDPEQAQEEKMEHEIHLELDDLPVPKPIENGSGFQPTIDGWQGVEIEVGM